jgi:hypothetical protein
MPSPQHMRLRDAQNDGMVTLHLAKSNVLACFGRTGRIMGIQIRWMSAGLRRSELAEPDR